MLGMCFFANNGFLYIEIRCKTLVFTFDAAASDGLTLQLSAAGGAAAILERQYMTYLRSVTSTVARTFLILALAIVPLASGAARADAQGRDIVQLNRAWTFTLGDPAGAGAGGDVGKDCEKINLPHSFSMPYFL